MIRPGLERISRLLQGVNLPWKAIHVAGTNGKGSTCAYLSAMLHAAGLRAGRFTSPHVLDRWDCVVVDEQPVAEAAFLDAEAAVKRRDAEHSIGASEFELLTATAFHLFTRARVDVAVVECGMGGRLDATNVFEKPLVAAITRVGLDHQAFLGDTLSAIATEKAGIMKPGAPCVVDSSNDPEPLAALRAHAASLGVSLYTTPSPPNHPSSPPMDPSIPYDALPSLVPADADSPHASNMHTALAALSLALPQLGVPPSRALALAPVMRAVALPGRCQTLSLAPLTRRAAPALLDGAHNAQAFARLAAHVDRRLRPREAPVTWLLALSKGKEPAEVFAPVLPRDRVLAVDFGPVDGMPWVAPVGAERFHAWREGVVHMGGDVRGALEAACDAAGEGPLVVAGSLYLMSDVLRLLREQGG